MIERLSGEFNRGYTRAIQDMTEVIDYIQADLKHHNKRLNKQMLDKLMKCCLGNRENLRENRNGFIRWNCTTNNFEWFQNVK